MEEDEQDLVMKEMRGSRAGSVAGSEAVHARSGSAGPGTNVYGGGAMPGPQYLLNMHPGVPVQVGRMGR